MFNKLYDKIKNFIRKNYKDIVFLFIFFAVMNYPVDYSIMVSGGIINVDDRVEIIGESGSEGSYNLAYVSELKGTIPTLLLSYIIPSWQRVPLEEFQASEEETIQDINKRSKIYLDFSEQAAMKIAYEKAGKEFTIIKNQFYVVYVDEEVESDIKIGDILYKIEGVLLQDMNQYREFVEQHEVGDDFLVTVKRDGKEKELGMIIREIDGKKLTGISVLSLYEYETSPKIDLHFKNNESGSSGGLMLTLAIYDKLIDEDLTKGLKIVGTGTIDFEGNVGEIDGVRYKLMGAVKAKADVFLVPEGSNYEECKKLQEEKGYEIQILSVATFDEALTKLSQLQS